MKERIKNWIGVRLLKIKLESLEAKFKQLEASQGLQEDLLEDVSLEIRELKTEIYELQEVIFKIIDKLSDGEPDPAQFRSLKNKYKK